MNTKRLIIALILTLALALTTSAQVKEKQNFNFTVGDNPSLKLANVVGDVTITGWDRSEIVMEAVKYANGRDAEKYISQIKINAHNSGNTVVVDVVFPSGKNRNLKGDKNQSIGVDLELKVPSNCRVKVDKLIAGDLIIEDINSSIYAGLISGDLIARNLGGDVTLSLVTGDIIADGLNGHSKVAIVTGDIDLEKVTGELEVSGTSGDVNINAIDLHELTVMSTSGDVEVNIDSAVTFGNFEFDLNSGTIDLTIPASSTFNAFLKCSNGDVESDFELQRKKGFMENILRGEVNGGGANINATIFSGEISLNSK